MTHFSARRLLAIAKKESLHILRDWRSMFLTIVTPLLMLLLFGCALTLDVEQVPLTIYDQSRTPQSRDFIQRYLSSPYFTLAEYADSFKAVERSLDSSRGSLALVIPRDFATDLQNGRRTKVQVLVDGSDSSTALTALAYAEKVAYLHTKALQDEYLGFIGKKRPKEPVDLRSRIWFNEDLESRNTIVPGLVGVIMMVIASLMTSLTIAREWEKGTMEQLISTPIKKEELLFGKILPYFVLGCIDVALIVAIGYFFFAVPFRGSLLLLFMMATFFLTGALSLGLLISIITKNQLLASQLAMVVTFLPSFLLSGFLSAIHNMPEVIQWITYLVPARYFITFLRAIYLKGVGLQVLYVEALFMVSFAVIALALARFRFQKKLT